MHWFFASLIAPFIWSIVNHTDKLLLSRYFHGGSGGLMVFVGVVALPFALLIWLCEPTVIYADFHYASILVLSGVLYNLAAYLYLKALEVRDASYVVPFWQLTPVCAYFFGIVLLGEYVSMEKLLGGLVVIGGAIFLSIARHRGNRWNFDIRTVTLMSISSAMLALCYVLFKDAESAFFWQSMFWNQIGMALFGIFFFLIPQFRGEFLTVVRSNTSTVVVLNVFEQILEIIGVVAANFAILLAPAAVVVLVEYASQPFFVFLLGVLLTIVFPRLVHEDISGTTIAKKIIAIAIMTVGLLLVLR